MGCRIEASDAGVPVAASNLLFVEYADDGTPTLYPTNTTGKLKPLCGISVWDASRSRVERIHIALHDTACTGEDAATHELGHALSALRRHAADGVMARGKTPEWSPVITEQSLALACAGTPCTAFVPER